MTVTIGITPSATPVTDMNMGRERRGFTLVETMVALVILAGVVLGMAMSTITFSRNVASTDMRSRAQARADLQIARARAWPSYATLSDLAATTYNPTDGGLKTETSVTVDTTAGLNHTVVQVTITGSPTKNLPIPVKRSITIAAP